MSAPTLTLSQRLSQPGLIVAPGVFDMVSLRLADSFGFDALYMTGFGTVASHLGLPDAGLATYSDMVGRVKAMAGMARTPLIADGDTGYGGLLNMRHTVQGYEAAGAAAIQIEDQEFPKKCGHTPGRRVIPLQDMVRKIRVAVEARQNADFKIIARTDARTSLGLDEALRRAEAYARAGADIVVAHLGLTSSGTIGAKSTLSLADAPQRTQAIGQVRQPTSGARFAAKIRDLIVRPAQHAAADAGDGWGYRTIRSELRRARLTGQSPWDTFAGLADRLGVTELAELAASVSLAGSHGARIRASLAAKADTLRGHQIAETEAAAEAATERMTVPVAVLLFGFLVFIAYPAIAQITSVSGPTP